MSALNIAQIETIEIGSSAQLSSAAGSLGNTTEYVSIIPNERTIETRRNRYAILEAVRRMLFKHGADVFRVSNCMRQVVGHEFTIKHNGKAAYYSGVGVCGSVWLCPICSQKIAASRRNEFRQAAAAGYSAFMVTFTMQHNSGERLSALVSVLNDSLRSLKGGRWWQTFQARHGIVAYATALEFTYSQVNGWHPHKHMVIYSKLPADQIDIADIRETILKRYVKLMNKHSKHVSLIYGVDVVKADSTIGNYVSKWGIWNEMSQASLKDGAGSLTPFQLVEMAADGHTFAEQAFMEYAYATFGKRQITWSHGARELLGIGAEQTDKQIAADDPDDDVAIVTLPRYIWKVIIEHNAQVEVLEQAERGGADAVMQFLASLSPP